MTEIEQLLDQFEEAWQRGTPPPCDQFLSAQVVPDESARRKLLIELVKIDLQWRWARPPTSRGPRQSGPLPDRPLLKDYVQQFRQLGALDQLPIDLIGEEYRVRRCWGDRPGHAEYVARFATQAARLKEMLEQIDASLAAELTGNGLPVRGSFSEEAVPVLTVGKVMETLRKHQLVSAAQLKELTDLAGLNQAQPQRQPRLADARTLAKHLLEQNWLTPYQVNQLLLGRGAELVLGPYLLLERLGEGGAGQVFKARHQKMKRAVALKLIRKELLADADVVARFYREIQIVSQLDHPNVVHAYDAGPFGVTHFLAMEFVEGTDLGKLVKQGGPLPVHQACEYIRQTALGLQHAHERGLVHRDIKPHNLIVSRREALVKVADLGLARLPRTGNDEVTAALSGAKGTGTLTPENAFMMGTADYLAPEQALDFHKADIRADIYSLGCTFYFLLTGQPPFPGKTLAEKLLKHQQAEPPPLEKIRSDLPPGLVVVLRRMLAKRPQDRFQTPAEVVAALESLLGIKTTPAAPLRSRSRRRLVILGGAAGVLLLGLVVFLGWPRPSYSPDSGSLRAISPELNTPKATWQHEKPVLTVVFSPDNQLVASSGHDKVIRLWDISKGQERAPIMGHKNHPGPVANLRFLYGSDGRWLISVAKGDQTSYWKWWTVDSGQDQQAEFPSTYTSARSIHFGSGKNVMLEQKDGSLILGWLGSPTIRGTIKGGHAFKCLAFCELPENVAVQDAEGKISLWDYAPEPPKFLRPLTSGPTDPALALAFSPEGKTLAAVGQSKSVKLWETTTGQERTILTDHSGTLLAVAFSPDGKLIATGSSDSTAKLCDVTSLKIVATLKGHTGPINSVVFSRDGKFLATGSDDHSVRLWDMARTR
ncbi:hypothetical protein AYO44_06615 [Planctomycetaceae bacterium SCGC AG-212-F19]|nr:hypothetical protein AYO44_06615 [Planctomycetaceae bacterium SCGC AG-212-F19]